MTKLPIRRRDLIEPIGRWEEEIFSAIQLGDVKKVNIILQNYNNINITCYEEDVS